MPQGGIQSRFVYHSLSFAYERTTMSIFNSTNRGLNLRSTHIDGPSDPGPTRRRVVQSGAWLVPIVAVAAAVPATAASGGPLPCVADGCPEIPLEDGWDIQVRQIVPNTGAVGYQSSWSPATGDNACTTVSGGTAVGTIAGVVVGEGDPESPDSYLMYSRVFCLPADTEVNLQWSWATYGTNNRAAFFQMYFEPYFGQAPVPEGGVAVGAQLVAPARTANLTALATGQFRSSQEGQYLLKMVWTFENSGIFGSGNICEYGTNDIAIYNLTRTCDAG